MGTPKTPNSNDLLARYVNESGLYQLTLRSKLEMADSFQDWIVDEVLPTIRKRGRYEVTPHPSPQETNSWGQKRVDGADTNS